MFLTLFLRLIAIFANNYFENSQLKTKIQNFPACEELHVSCNREYTRTFTSLRETCEQLFHPPGAVVGSQLKQRRIDVDVAPGGGGVLKFSRYT